MKTVLIVRYLRLAVLNLMKMKRRTRLIVSTLMVISVSGSAVANECLLYDYSGAVYPWKVTEHYKGDGFSIQLPKGWPRKTDALPYRSETGSVSGVEVNGPDGEYGVNIKMIFGYYKNGGMYKDYRGYLNLRTNSFVRTDPLKEIALKATLIDGKKGMMFEMETFELVYEESFEPFEPKPGIMYKMGYRPSMERLAPTKKVIMSNKEWVIPLKQGFLVARFDIPKTLLTECSPMMESILLSIKFDH